MKRNATKNHRGKKTETGGSDPTFLASSRPKSSWGRSRPAAQKPVPPFFHGDNHSHKQNDPGTNRDMKHDSRPSRPVAMSHRGIEKR